ncbi:peroxiredoxin [Bacillus salacetis]|uniref:Peroxiredoxin n=1 Tax=Bacillus salacetis TaxID=2315464 RepID=A0A3A1R7P7_9BACI|nr:peroxiredoxin [Bacillus salacetis]
MYPVFQSLNAEVLAISTDSVYAHKVFTEVSPMLSNVMYPLVSDRNHEISRSYRVLNAAAGAATRATIIIDPEGLIISKMVYPSEVGRNIYEILRLLQGIQYSCETGKGVPANWMPGNPGIAKGANLIGKI